MCVSAAAGACAACSKVREGGLEWRRHRMREDGTNRQEVDKWMFSGAAVSDRCEGAKGSRGGGDEGCGGLRLAGRCRGGWRLRAKAGG